MNNCKFILAYNIKTGSIIDDLQIEKTGVAMIVSFATENKMDTPIRLEKGWKKKPTEPMGSWCSWHCTGSCFFIHKLYKSLYILKLVKKLLLLSESLTSTTDSNPRGWYYKKEIYFGTNLYSSFDEQNLQNPPTVNIWHNEWIKELKHWNPLRLCDDHQYEYIGKCHQPQLASLWTKQWYLQMYNCRQKHHKISPEFGTT